MLEAERPQGSTKNADRTGCRGFSGFKHRVLQPGVERGWVCHLAAPLPGAREEAESSPGTRSIHFHPKLNLAAFQERNQAIRGGRGFLTLQSSFLKKPRGRTHPALAERATSLLGTSCTVGRGQPLPVRFFPSRAKPPLPQRSKISVLQQGMPPPHTLYLFFATFNREKKQCY